MTAADEMVFESSGNPDDPRQQARLIMAIARAKAHSADSRQGFDDPDPGALASKTDGEPKGWFGPQRRWLDLPVDPYRQADHAARGEDVNDHEIRRGAA